MFIVVTKDKCTGCETCVSVCPYDAIVMKDGKADITELCQVCRACLGACPEGAIKETEAAGRSRGRAEGTGVWVFAEQREGVVAGVSFELLGAGRQLADRLETELSAVLFGASAVAADELIKWGADKVFLCEDSKLAGFNDEPYADLLSRLSLIHI